MSLHTQKTKFNISHGNLQLAYCRVGRQHAPPAPTTTASPLNAALNMLNDTLDSVHQSFLTIAGVKSDEEFFAKARGHIDTLQNTITSTVNDLNEEVRWRCKKKHIHQLLRSVINFFFFFLFFLFWRQNHCKARHKIWLKHLLPKLVMLVMNWKPDIQNCSVVTPKNYK